MSLILFYVQVVQVKFSTGMLVLLFVLENFKNCIFLHHKKLLYFCYSGWSREFALTLSG